MKIVYMGTAEFAKKPLEKLLKTKHEISLVITNEDKPYGRGKKLKPSCIKELALANSIEVLTPKSLKKEEGKIVLEKLKEIAPDIIVVCAYGKILPKGIIEAAKYGTINIHGSLLPEYRGAAPIQRAVLDGKEKTGVTIMYVDEGLDTGDMILKEEVEIRKNDTTATMFEKLSEVGAELLIKAIKKIEDGTAQRIKQDESIATYAKMLEKEEAYISFEDTSKIISDKVRGMNGALTAKAIFEDKTYKIYEIEIVEENEIEKIEKENNVSLTSLEPGKYLITKKNIYVKSGDGVIKLKKIQAPNKKKMSVHDFLLGNSTL